MQTSSSMETQLEGFEGLEGSSYSLAEFSGRKTLHLLT